MHASGTVQSISVVVPYVTRRSLSTSEAQVYTKEKKSHNSFNISKMTNSIFFWGGGGGEN